MSLPSNSVGPVTERITTIGLAEQHQNVCMPWASECFPEPSVSHSAERGQAWNTPPHSSLLALRLIRYLTTSSSCSHRWRPRRTTHSRFSTSISACRASTTGAPVTRIPTGVSLYMPLAPATVRAAGSIAHLATGHAVLIPPCPVGSGGTRRRGDLTQDRGGRGWIICIASRRRSRMYSQMILLG
jgi:hypothetical protein